MRYLLILALLAFSFQAQALPVTLKGDIDVSAITGRIDALEAKQADVAQLRIDLERLSDAVSAINGSVNVIATELATVRGMLAVLDERVTALEKPDPKPDPTERTENEKLVLAAAAPLLAYNTPGPDMIACEAPWFCVADTVTNPAYADRIDVTNSIQHADAQWVAAGRPADGGIAIMPGVHVISNMSNENFARHGSHIRAQDKTAETIIECQPSWASKFCIRHRNTEVLTLEGFEVRNAWCRNRCAAVGAESNVNSRLVLIDMTLRDSDNGIRTTGRWVALFNVRLIGNARSTVAHGAYISNDNVRGKHCPVVVAVNVVSTGNRLAHAFKSRCKVTYIKGGSYEAVNGFAIDNVQGGRMLVEDVDIVQKTPSPQWVVIAHGLDKLVRDTGFATEKYIGYQHQVANVWKGRTTLRDVRIVNERDPGFGGIWNDSKYRLPVTDADGNYVREPNGSFVYDPASEVFIADPVEMIGVTVDGQPATANDVRGPVEIIQ